MAEAVERTGQVVAERIHSRLATVDEPAEAVRTFVLALPEHVEALGFRSGGPTTFAALEAAATSERVREACRGTYRSWQAAFRDRLLRGGTARNARPGWRPWSLPPWRGPLS